MFWYTLKLTRLCYVKWTLGPLPLLTQSFTAMQLPGLQTVVIEAAVLLYTSCHIVTGACTVVTIKIDSDTIFCLQLLSKTLTCTLRLS